VGKYPKLSERRACLILDVPRSTMRHQEVPKADEGARRAEIRNVAEIFRFLRNRSRGLCPGTDRLSGSPALHKEPRRKRAGDEH